MLADGSQGGGWGREDKGCVVGVGSEVSGDAVDGWYPGRAGNGQEVEAEDATIRNSSPASKRTRGDITPADPRQLLAGIDELSSGCDGMEPVSAPKLIESVTSRDTPIGGKEATVQPHDRRVLVGRPARTAVPMAISANSDILIGRKEATAQPHDRRVLVGRSARTAVPLTISLGPEARQSIQSFPASGDLKWVMSPKTVRDPDLAEVAPDESSIVGPMLRVTARPVDTAGSYPYDPGIGLWPRSVVAPDDGTLEVTGTTIVPTIPEQEGMAGLAVTARNGSSTRTSHAGLGVAVSREFEADHLHEQEQYELDNVSAAQPIKDWITNNSVPMALSRAEYSDYARRQGDQWTNESVLEAGTRASDPGRYRHADAYGTMALSRAVSTG